ncbi:6-pyruvoyl tetrahydrobiopterin synthase [Candidatus Caldarchaeum subterraneum]|uniref:6-pyruvoyl tetrahydrobiopterin synthase n=1 Tax=Caldiarchaeum subterraneum TaxID=311458 RepID=E6N9E2_CALS0|nr:6-pyruvoyl tetrahydrobiopterin synthase [Candidatus Caldarchaeum subterraneum]BAJ49780.1 6-pyruvoyl tetrahydrobiopterin synthase [Candidatus Caldarchaeum subterraneum]BAJ51532.1 6-pyruvoyl tetrahydrobiopterin synthase [Candidatus Caldarchaeum subterraneum]
MSKERLKKIEVSGPGINFDYAHFLPSSPKCGVLHGHSSTVSVTVVGKVVDEMVVEFGELKKIVKKVVDAMDHKLIVCRKYLSHLEDGKVKVEFDGVGGHYEFILPINSVYVIERDSTVENISEHIAARLREMLPPNVQRIHVRMSEGFGKYATSSL